MNQHVYYECTSFTMERTNLPRTSFALEFMNMNVLSEEVDSFILRHANQGETQRDMLKLRLLTSAARQHRAT